MCIELLAFEGEGRGRHVGMWYEILPSMAVMYVGLIIPGLSTIYIQRYINNGKDKRVIRKPQDYEALRRERRVCNTGFKGLEKID